MANGITNKAVEKYLYSLLPKSGPVLEEMERLAKKNDIPIVGPAVGRLLALLVEITEARRIFELGSAIGYSTIWLARAAGPRAEIFYTDGSPENARRAERYFERAGVRERIHVCVGNALDLLDTTSGPFDLVFNDVNKAEYPAVFRKAVPRLKAGGLLITDNTLWYGRVARKAPKRDADTRGIQQFNRLAYSSKKVSTVLLPIRDGVGICRKL